MAVAQVKVALVTGGASGIGLAVVQALSARGGWQIHIVDIKENPGELPPTCFYHRADTTAYNDLADAFRAAFEAGGKRLDFLFANAGIFERGNWYSPSASAGEPPPEPDWSALETNLKGCMNTVRIGRYYMAQSPRPDKGSIVVTGSVAGIWPSYFSPMYTASKHGVVGFMRSVAESYYTFDNIRINALCPSIVRTEILPDEVWDRLPKDAFTPLEIITKVVLMFIDGETITDSRDKTASKVYGQTVVPSSNRFYLNEVPDYCDEIHRALTEGTHVAHMGDALERKETL
ncbi:hypothetical protein N8I77_007112 [Diaporthe amygdali]|uniref:Uncharacterized protein n=1 Tax=Phomopsis amygdali TaxID=1214568 RepID=A0AAD9W194_PHOAM|nr:hypothetical protein N8I77_007112 [Diaporthe amygdali]